MNIHSRCTTLIHTNFHALTHADFRYFWLGQCISLIGTWMQNVGQSWLVLSTTDSPFLLGLTGVVQFLPVMVFSLFAGVIIDKFPKKKILLATQGISMVLALALASLVFTHTVRFEYILILAFLLGCVNAFDMPTRQAYAIEIVGREDLMNAIALNSAIFNLARIIGPAMAGIVMGYVGAGWCFLFNGLSFIAVIYGLTRIQGGQALPAPKTDKNVLQDIRDGLKYIAKDPLLLRTVLMVSVIGIFAYNYNVLLPVLTRDVLHQGEKGYGFLMSFLGAGSLLGAILMSTRSQSGPRYKVMLLSALAVSVLLIANGVNSIYLLTGLILALNGVFNITFSTTANSTLQLHSSDQYRGRVMSVYALVFGGTTPFGNLYAGSVTDHWGPAVGFWACGAANLGFILLLALLFRGRSNKVAVEA